MHYRRLRPGIWVAGRAISLALLVAAGCSPQEELKPDPGVSPFYPGPSAETKATPGPRPSGPSADPGATGGAPDTDAPLRPQDVERQLRIALRAADKGDLARATTMLDRILALEPVNREALYGRATVSLEQAKRAPTPGERLAAAEKASEVAQTLRRAYERPNKNELELNSRVLAEELRANVAMDRLDRAVAVLKRAHEAGFDASHAVERDPALAKLRDAKVYQDLVKSIDANNLAQARAAIGELLAKEPKFSFDFNLKDLDGKPLSLAQLRGQLVLVDFWGTWCSPCREAIPGLIQLHRKYGRRGLEIVGLDFEKQAVEPAEIRKFVKDAGVTYPVAIGDEELIKQVPGFQGFPTTLLIDRTGKVRAYLTGGGPQALAALNAAIEVLLAEPAGQPSAKPATTAKESPSSPAPAVSKGAARPQ